MAWDTFQGHLGDPRRHDGDSGSGDPFAPGGWFATGLFEDYDDYDPDCWVDAGFLSFARTVLDELGPDLVDKLRCECDLVEMVRSEWRRLDERSRQPYRARVLPAADGTGQSDGAGEEEEWADAVRFVMGDLGGSDSDGAEDA